MSVVHFDRLIPRHHFSKHTFQTHQLKPALLREPMVSAETPDRHKEMQDEENGPQMSSGFVWSAVVTTFQQPGTAELIHKSKKVLKTLTTMLQITGGQETFEHWPSLPI